MEPLVEQLLSFVFGIFVGGVGAGAEGLSPMRPPDPIPGCHELLKRADVRFEPSRIPLHPSPEGNFMCGAPDVVRYKGGPGKLRWSSTPKVSCAMASALGRFESIVQEVAEDKLGRRVKRVRHVGTYNCREMSAYSGWVSEHSYANAIDIAAFELGKGREITIGEHWADAGPKGQFLRRLARRLFDEHVFAGVLTPDFDELHRNHMHLDMAHYRSDGAG